MRFGHLERADLAKPIEIPNSEFCDETSPFAHELAICHLDFVHIPTPPRGWKHRHELFSLESISSLARLLSDGLGKASDRDHRFARDAEAIDSFPKLSGV